MKKHKKVIIIILCCLLSVLVIAGIVIVCVLSKNDLETKPEELKTVGDRIHFINTRNSDAILLESDGKFALVDAAEDSDNVRNLKELNYRGYEDRVIDYLKEYAANENGKIHLEFVVGTHSHSDHIGGFDTIINHPDVTVDRAYLKVYDSSKIDLHEVENWDNQEVYDQMVEALNNKSIPIISDMDSTPFEFGNFTITLMNTDDPESEEKVGENDQSLGVLIEKNGTRIFLAGDIDNKSGDETRLAPQIGKVHLLKPGHHGYDDSSTEEWMQILSPDNCVITNTPFRLSLFRIKYFDQMTKDKVYYTASENGVIAEIFDNGEIKYHTGR